MASRYGTNFSYLPLSTSEDTVVRRACEFIKPQHYFHRSRFTMMFVAFLALLAVAHGGVVEKRALTSMDAASLASFTKMFRKTLLEQVALEWNTTLAMTNTLKAKMTTCNATINSKVTECKKCTSTQCESTPSMLDYLALANPYTYLQGPLNDLSSKFTDVKNLLGDEAATFFNSIKGVAGSTTDAISSSFTSALNTAVQGLTDLGHSITDVGHQVGNTLTDAGHAIEHAGSSIGHSIGHAIGSIFGKRDLDPKAVECMQKCSACHPLLLPQDKMVAQLCGADVVSLNTTITTRVHKIKGVYDAALNTASPILSKLEFDMSSANAQMQLTTVFLTVQLNGQTVRYQTAVPYAMMQLPQTAHDIAMEYWNKAQ